MFSTFSKYKIGFCQIFFFKFKDFEIYHVHLQFQYIRVSWTDVSNETSYLVQRCTVTGKGRTQTCGSIVTIPAGQNVTQIQDIPPAGTYKYQVQSYNSVTNLSSNWSTAVQVSR